MKCRHCGTDIKLSLVDLGSSPPSNAYLTEQSLHAPEKWFPLRVLVCEHCWLVQTEDFAQAADLFNSEYAYFSGVSSTWLAHCERYVSDVVSRFNLTTSSHVVEVASNDGYLLQYFKTRNIPCTGIEPTAKTAAAALAKGIPVVQDFFGMGLARKLVTQNKQADLIIANNVLAHVPDINDFVAGFTLLLKPDGIATFEFPHLFKLISESQFDTIYHEHFSYLSLTAVSRILSTNGLNVFDVEECSTHGGSLRVYAQRIESGQQSPSTRVNNLLKRESTEGMLSADYYSRFQEKAETVKNNLLAFLLEARRKGESVVAYGAAAKGNTLMNYAGIRQDLIHYVVDRNPEKQGKYMPGSRIPIVDESMLKHTKPSYVVILPWNLESEVKQQLEYIGTWGGRFVTAVPKLRVWP